MSDHDSRTKKSVCKRDKKFKYFLMLGGTDDLIKPDRMIRRFLESLGIKGISLYESQILFNNVVQQMNSLVLILLPENWII